jgi:hypothetical protein
VLVITFYKVYKRFACKILFVIARVWPFLRQKL